MWHLQLNLQRLRSDSSGLSVQLKTCQACFDNGSSPSPAGRFRLLFLIIHRGAFRHFYYLWRCMMTPVELLNSEQLSITITRLCHQLIENHGDFAMSAIVGLQPRGVYLADRIVKKLTEITGIEDIRHGALDITFHRDDFRRKSAPSIPSETQIDFVIEDLNVVLVDDVLFTGRTIRAGLDALMAFGRPKRVELLVLIDRRFSRHLPVQANYVGRAVDSISSERVTVDWIETEGIDKVTLYSTPESL
jgi:pyrimidine operon attenuation protein/uracil phosphoribosyltransferase